MKDIVFTKDFAGKKKGNKWACDSLLASQLVRVDKVADYVKPATKKDKK
jgi:hypothetical protein